MKYLNKEENLDTFKSFVKINYYSIYTMQNVDRKEILETIQKRILNEQKKIHRKKIYFKFFKYAAVLILFFSLGYYYSTFSKPIGQ